MLARLGALVFVSLAITATAIEMTRKGEKPAPPTAVRADQFLTDPLREDLRRCAGLGEAGGRDPDCLRTWAKNRERFLSPKTRTHEEAR